MTPKRKKHIPAANAPMKYTVEVIPITEGIRLNGMSAAQFPRICREVLVPSSSTTVKRR